LRFKLYLMLLLALIVIFPGCGKKEAKPNILLITIDTLRKDYVGCYGFPLATTPFIDRLAKEGLRFEHVVTPIPLTDPSHTSILSSLHPLTHQLIQNATKLDDKIETIAEVLKKNGYYTMGTVAVRHLSGGYNFSQGFDSYSAKWDRHKFKGNIEWQREAGSVNESAMAQIDDYLEKTKTDKKPLFMWIHYYDPHSTYLEHEDIDLKKDLNEGALPQRKINYKYAGEIRYTDNHINVLYRYLEQKGLTKHLLTCITSDHGEQLGEHGYSGHHYDFYSECTFVPLVFHGYKIPKNKTVGHYVSTMDIAVTLLELVNLGFEKKVNGVCLLEADGTPKPPPDKADKDRDFLVIGDPMRIRSIQKITPPFSYILNFDRVYFRWYLSLTPDLQVDGLEPIPAKDLHVKYSGKSDKERITFDYPYSIRQGLHYAVLQFDVRENAGLSLGFVMGPGIVKSSHQFDKKKTGTVTAFFPMTPLDYSSFYINKKRETKIVNPRYAIVTEAEFKKTAPPSARIELKNDIIRALKTRRRFIRQDELFNLDTDFGMETNLLETGDFTAKKANERKSIYNYLKFYWNEKSKLLGKTVRTKSLTREEKDMLKSLGYL